MLRKILIAAVLLSGMALSAQDIFWVKETVNADTVGTVNTFADPYGIQQAFVAITTTDFIRIVKGADDYDSTTASWTNRTDATKDINTTKDFNSSNWGDVSCWDDETTRNNDVGGCLFNFATGTGIGFHITHNGYIFRNLGVTNATSIGFSVAGPDFITLYKCSAFSVGTDGFTMTGTRNHVVYSLAHSNTGGYGFNFAVTGGVAYRVEAHGNLTAGMRLGASKVVGLLTYSNTGDGLEMDGAGGVAAQVTAWNNGADGIVVTTNGEYTAIVDSISSENTVYNLQAEAGSLVYLLENFFTYNGGTGEILETGIITVQVNVTAPTGAAITFTSATDFLPTSSNVELSILWPRGTTTSEVLAGAIQDVEPVAAGATAYVH